MLRAGFQAASRGSGCVERDLVVAGRGVKLRFAGPALVEPISGALAHLESREAALPAATVLLWDSASTGVPLPPVPWRMSDLDDHGQSRGYRVRGWDEESIYTLHDQDYGAMTIFDGGSRTAIYATLDAREVPSYERAAPLRAALHWSLSEPGRHLVHAGAVGGAEGGVIVAGRSGSGKSTLTLSCVEAGLGYLGDDYVLIDLAGEPTAHAVHSTAKIDERAIAQLPALAPAILARDGWDADKVVLDLHRHRPSSLMRRVAVRAVVLPRVAQESACADPGGIGRRGAPRLGAQHGAPTLRARRRWDGHGRRAAASRARVRDRAGAGHGRRGGGRGTAGSGPGPMTGAVVSVVMPVHNGERFLAEAIDSVLDQTYPHREIVVVDDGSVDRSAEIARSRPVRYLRQANRGVAAARNAGLAVARGDFIAFLDQDDTWLPHKLEAQLAFLFERPSVDMVVSPRACRTRARRDAPELVRARRRHGRPARAPARRAIGPAKLRRACWELRHAL